MSVFEDVNSIYSLITEMGKLRNLIKCPICLDIVNNPVEISCGHIYCSDCIDTFINEASSKLNCPLCRKTIKRQRQKPNLNIQQLIKFVTIVTEKFKSQLGCDISVVSSADNVLNILNKIGNNILASNSKTKSERKSKTFLKLTQSHLQDTLVNTSAENKKDVFDLFVESSPNELTVRRDKTDKTYTRKNQVKEKDEVLYQKLINFEDDAYRLKIIDWLCDNKNKFNRLTQTQSIIDDDTDSMASSLDMPSISETMGPVSLKPKHKTRSKKRTRSLDVKVNTPKINSRRYSFSEEPQEDVEIINIEEVESDKDVVAKEHVNILHMLEEKCLNTIESELAIQNQKKIIPDEPKKLRKRKRKNKAMNDGAKATTSGWIRAQEINKTFSKTVREPKKLYVSLSSSSKLGKKHGANNVSNIKNAIPSKAKNKKPKEPVVQLNRLSSEFELYKHSPSPKKAKIYCLDKVETYISSNIQKVYQSPEKENDNTDFVSVGKINNNTCIQNETSADFKKVNESDVMLQTIEGSIKNKPSGASGSIFSQKIKAEEMEDLYTIPTQKITHETEIDNVERNLIALFSSPEKTQNECGPSDTLARESTIAIDIDNLLHHLDDTINTLYMSYKNNRNIDDLKLCIEKLKLMFSKITKEPINQLGNEMRECINSTTQTLTFDTKSIAVQTEDCASSGFKISSTADFKTIMQCNVEVQTDFVVSGASEHQAETSKKIYGNFESVTKATQATGTMACEDLIYIISDTSANNISSQEMLNNSRSPKPIKDNYQFTESMDNINFDTQAILDQNKVKRLNNVNNENKIIQETNRQTQLQNRARKKLILCKQEEIDSNNCINNNEIVIIESGETIPLPSNSETTEKMEMKRNKGELKEKNTQSSTISFSLELNKCNQNALSAESIKKFKRARALMEDSDSDDGFIKKIKKKENPYLNPNLSVEFVSQDTQKTNNEKKAERENSPNSTLPGQSLNYDEYLEKIMQKYDENQIKTSTPKKEPLKQTKSQRIVDKCNVLIKQAAASPPFVPNQNKVCDERSITSADIINEFDLTFDETVIHKEAQLSVAEKNFLTNKKEDPSCNDVINVGSSQNMPFSNVECLALEFANEMKPLPDNHGETSSQIIILQNIPLRKENVSHSNFKLEYNLEEEWQKMEDADKNSVKSEEVFSDCDTDVVETTPQKNKTALLIGQSHQKRHSTYASPVKLPPPEESPDIFCASDASSYLNETFDPPTEFQDGVIDGFHNEERPSLVFTDKDDITLVPLSVVKAQNTIVSDKTLTDKQVAESQQICDKKEQDKIDCDTDDDVFEVPASNALQQCEAISSLKSTCLKPNVRDANLIERALNSNYNPLEIILSKPQRKELSSIPTSTPKKQKSILTYITSHPKASQQTIGNLSIAVEQVKPCIACTRLSKDQVIAICSLTNKKLATYSTSFNDSVTHMVVSLKENKCIEHHTMKFVLAVAAGIWVLGFEWIQECLFRNEIVSEEPFEALDVSGKPGPRISRLTRLNNPLLKGFQIHAAAPFVSISKEDIEKVIVMLGGEVVSSLEALHGKSGIRLIIAETKATQDFDIYETWLDICKVVTVDIEWLSRSVGQYQLLSLRPFTLCSDDHIGELGYPEELLINTPFSFSQSTYNC